MNVQDFLIVLIGIVAFGIFFYKIYRWGTKPDPCAGCEGCALKQEIRQTKRKRKGFSKIAREKGCQQVKMWIALLIGCSGLWGCEKITEPSAVNQWIYNQMKNEYLYFEDIPDNKSLDFSATPESFFHKLLSAREIRNSGSYLSTIEENKTSTTRAFDDAADWYGFDMQFWRIENGDIVASVLYCQKESPAFRSGIRRGDLIYSIDSVKLSTNSYSELRSGQNRRLGRYQLIGNTLHHKDEVLLQASESVHRIPILMDSVIVAGNKKVAYLVYNTFATGPAGFVDKSYEVDLLEKMARFRTEGVDDLVLDLRYNGGGYIEECAVLASCLVKSEQLGKLFAYTLTNEKVNQRSNKEFSSSSKVGRSNLNLSRLFVLTTRRTASASELLINGLKPFCEVIQIGSKTEGKNIGSYAIKDSRYMWTLYPITLNIYNSKGENDYAKGYIPTNGNLLEEKIFLHPFGDIRDPFLAKALETIHPSGQLMGRSSLKYEEKFVSLPLDLDIPHSTWMIEGDRE